MVVSAWWNAFSILADPSCPRKRCDNDKKRSTEHGVDQMAADLRCLFEDKMDEITRSCDALDDLVFSSLSIARNRLLSHFQLQ